VGQVAGALWADAARVKDLPRMTNLNTVFEVHEDAAHAVRSFVQLPTRRSDYENFQPGEEKLAQAG
jgi:hypothetical protein